MSEVSWQQDETTRRLLSIEKAAWKLSQVTGYGHKPLGSPGLDRELHELGTSHCRDHLEPHPPDAPQGPDVYVATEIYRDGGHTALIGDFVRAMKSIDQAKGPPQTTDPKVIITAYHRPDIDFSDPLLCQRMGIQPGQLLQLDRASAGTKLAQLCKQLHRLQPQRLFLFHHPFDPLGPAATHACPSSDTYLVHHGDSSPCLGLFLPGVRVIDVTPSAAAFGRLLGVNSCWLPLTIEDPGHRRESPGPAGSWTSCTCARSSKFRFDENSTVSYASAVATLLGHGCARHVHIGDMDPDRLREIREHLEGCGVDPLRFEQIDWVPSLAEALVGMECDWYLESWPQDGARSRIETMAAGVPFLRHVPVGAHKTERSPSHSSGGVAWQTSADLAETMERAATDPDWWRQHSDRQRAGYEALHHPSAFRGFLADITNGGAGAEDPWRSPRNREVERSMIKALALGLQHEALARHRSADILKLKGQLEKQRALIEKLADKVRRLQQPKPSSSWRKWGRKIRLWFKFS